MSKRDLKKYLSELDKTQLEEQIIELYDKFGHVKTYYDFVFNPKEDLLAQDAKIKISHEYFPQRNSGKNRRAKMRRSVAQNYIKHFTLLGVDPFIIADVMLYAIEIAQTFSSDKVFKSDLFYKSMLNAYQRAISFMIANGILFDFKDRILAINNETSRQNWFNTPEFSAVIDRLQY